MPTRALVRLSAIVAITAIGLSAAACGDDNAAAPTSTTVATPATSQPAAASTAAASPAASSLRITSAAFADGAAIPARYSCDGDSISPPLSWSGAPAGTQGFALIVDDPDAPVSGGVTHWVTYNLPASVTSLPEAVPEGPAIAGGGNQGANIRGALAYTGPCPPAGSSPHHYHFRLYALSSRPPLGDDASRADVLAAIGPLTIAEAEIVGLFGR